MPGSPCPAQAKTKGHSSLELFQFGVVPVQSCRRFCPNIFTKSALSPCLWLCLHCLQVLQLLHIRLSIRRRRWVARSVGSREGEVGNPADRDSLPTGRLCPQKPLMAALQATRVSAETGSVSGSLAAAQTHSGAQAEASGAVPAMDSSSHGGGASCLPQQVRLLGDRQRGPSSLSQAKELRQAPKK